MLNQNIFRLSLWAALTGLLFALLGGLFLFNMLTRRLTKLASTMETFKERFSEALELRILRISFLSGIVMKLIGSGPHSNRMVERILQQVATLKQTDILRRELVANVSHDLRTPWHPCMGIWKRY